MKEISNDIQKYSKSLIRKLEIESKSINTIKAYSSTYRQFIEFTEQYNEDLTLSTIVEDDIYAFLEYKYWNMKKQGELSSATKSAAVVHLKRLFNHITRNSREALEFNKVFEDIKFKAKTYEPKGISPKDSASILSHLSANMDSNSRNSLRDSFLFKVLLYGGLRASEAVLLKYDDFTKDKELNVYGINIIGKGCKARTIFIHTNLIKEEYEALKLNSISNSEYLVVNPQGNPISRIRLNKIINSIYAKVGIITSGVHVLRHTAAKNLLKSGINIATVQAFLGHASLSTTSIYTTTTIENIKNEIALMH